MEQTMTMADAGPVQLEMQEAWFNGLADGLTCPSTDEKTDEFIVRELTARGINTNDYDAEFSSETFGHAVLDGMQKWYASLDES